ncbi:MAG: VCBS repeat-containing protein [Bdellovibrionales bacterium]|nr:VCBS repeat-containing protein [Bdellovibrionales bacterium]
MEKVREVTRIHVLFAATAMALAISGCLGSRLKPTTRGTAATSTVTANPATSLTASVTAGTTLAAGDCAEVVVERWDSSLALTNEAVDLALTWATTGTGTFHAVDDCSDLATTSQTLLSGRSSSKIYFQPTLAGAETITVSAAGFTSVANAITVNPGAPADIIVLAGSGQTGGVTTTLALPYTVELRDAYLNLIPGATLTFTIQAGNGTTDVPSAVTDGVAQASVTHTLGTSTTSGQTVRVSTSNGITEDISATATPDVPAQWGVTGTGIVPYNLSGTIGACTGMITITQQDTYGNAVTAGAAIPLTFGGLSNITPYTASDCLSGAVGAPQIAMGSSSVSYYFATILQQTGNLTVNGAALTTGSISLTFTGKLTSTSTQTVTSNAAYVAVGDLDRNGAQDLVYSVTGSNEVSVILNSAGTLAAPVPLALSGNTVPRGLTLVDWDRDGDLDLVVAFGNATIDTSAVAWFANNGSGTLSYVGHLYGPANDAVNAADDPVAIASGDFNKDGRPDLIVVRQGLLDTSMILIGNGSGGISASNFFPTGAPTYDVVTGDFDRDGSLDAILANGSGLMFQRGDSSGSIISQTTAVAGNHALVQSIDWDKDGDLDLISYSGGNIVRSLNNGSGSFSATTLVSGLPAPAQFAILDIDRDGDYDLGLPQLTAAGRLSRFINTGAAPFTEESRFATGTFTTTAVAVDWDRDGFDDIISFDTTSAIFWKSSGTARPGTLGTSTTLTSGLNAPIASVVADFNRDGYPDIVTSHSSLNALRLTESDGAGGYLADVEFVIAGEFLAFATADFDNDGNLDVVGSMGDRGPGSQVAVFFGDGAGGFTVPSLVTVGSGPREILPIDFDRDGDVDLVVLNRDTLSAAATDTVSLLTNDGIGGFTASTLTVISAPDTIAKGDFNRDGIEDFVLLSRSGVLRVYLGNGAGSFAAMASQSISQYTNSLFMTVGDLDRDGDLDIALTSKSDDRLGIALNDGTGAFTVTNLSTPQDASGLTTLDFNQDGHLDLIYSVRGTTTDTLQVQLGTGGGAFATATVLGSVAVSDSIHFMDQNHDGCMDVFLLQNAAGTVVRLNCNP